MMRCLLVSAFALFLGTEVYGQVGSHQASHVVEITLPEISQGRLVVEQHLGTGNGPDGHSIVVQEFYLEGQFSRTDYRPVFVEYKGVNGNIYRTILPKSMEESFHLPGINPSATVTFSEI